MYYLYLGLWKVVDNVPLPLTEPRNLDAGHVGPGQTGPLPAPGEHLHTLGGVGGEARVDVEVRRSLETHSIAPPHNQAGTAISHPLLSLPGDLLKHQPSTTRSGQTAAITPNIK